MGEPKKIYVVMRASGAIMRFRDAIAGDNNAYAGPYTHILDVIANEMGSAGGDYDSPEKLFLNGKLVIGRGLSGLAYSYQKDALAARERARRAVNALHRPSWCDEEESYFSDARGWRVEKDEASAKVPA